MLIPIMKIPCLGLGIPGIHLRPVQEWTSSGLIPVGYFAEFASTLSIMCMCMQKQSIKLLHSCSVVILCS